MLGTAAYMAPERQDAAPVAPAHRHVRLGVLLYRNLTTGCRGTSRPSRTCASPPAHGPRAAARDRRAAAGGSVDLPACLDKNPAVRPTAAAAALLLAAAAGIEVYLPTFLERPSRVESPVPTEADPAAVTINPRAGLNDRLPDRPHRRSGRDGPVSATIECVWSAATPSAPGGPGGPAGPGRGCTLPCESATTSATRRYRGRVAGDVAERVPDVVERVHRDDAGDTHAAMASLRATMLRNHFGSPGAVEVLAAVLQARHEHGHVATSWGRESAGGPHWPKFTLAARHRSTVPPASETSLSYCSTWLAAYHTPPDQAKVWKNHAATPSGPPTARHAGPRRRPLGRG